MSLGARIDQVQADELPLNGRNWADLTALWRRPLSTPEAAASVLSGTPAVGAMTIILLMTASTPPTSLIIRNRAYVRLAMPLDTIQEFRVDAMLSTAEVEQPAARSSL